MESSDAPAYAQKRRRRRRPDKPALSSKLQFDESVNSAHVLLSVDLHQELFPDFEEDRGPSCYVAIAPWFPASNSILDDISWTIIPAKRASQSYPQHSTVLTAKDSHFMQSFNKALRSRGDAAGPTGRHSIEIRILDVAPLLLEKVFVKLDRSTWRDIESGQIDPNQAWDSSQTMVKATQKGIARMSSSSRRSKTDAFNKIDTQNVLKDLVRRAMSSISILRSGDSIILPIPSHPITHVPPLPAKVIHCNPVCQGKIGPGTQIVVIASSSGEVNDNQRQKAKQSKMQMLAVEEPDDTSEDHFYSAVEDRSHSREPSSPDSEKSGFDVDTDVSSSLRAKVSDGESSDSSLGDLITLSTPELPNSNVEGSVISGKSYGLVRGQITNGASTPGSVASNFTANTARAGGEQARIFKACELDHPISEEMLLPRPSAEEDDEARVYVDVASLAKIGCFSGDWVMVEPQVEQNIQEIGSWGLAFQSAEEKITNLRALKVYGLPESYAIRYQKMISTTRDKGLADSVGRRFSHTPNAFFPPLVLANMKNASQIKLSPLKTNTIGQEARLNRSSRAKSTKMPSHFLPPVAKEVKLETILTPLSTDRSAQSAIWASLKRHFEKRQRLLKTGDLIAVPFDLQLGQFFHSTGQTSNSSEDEVNLSRLLDAHVNKQAHQTNANIAWFRVGSTASETSPYHDREGLVLDEWNEVVLADSTDTRLVQNGSTKSNLPPATECSWKTYYNAPQPGSVMLRKWNSQARGSVSPLQKRLSELVAAVTSTRATYLGLSPAVILLSSSQRSIGKATMVHHCCENLGLHCFEINAYDILSEGITGGDTKTEAYLRVRSERALSCGSDHCLIMIRHIEILSSERLLNIIREVLEKSRVLVFTTTDVDKIPDSLRGSITHELEMSAPDELAREVLLQSLAIEKGLSFSSELDLSSVALKTASLVAGDLADVVDRAVVSRQTRIEKIVAKASTGDNGKIIHIRDAHIAGGPSLAKLTRGDFTLAVDAARKNFADAIGAPKIPNVGWDDVGGLSHVKDAVMETIQLPLERPELFAKGMKKRSGILFYGPPGTGKTLLAKAIATEFSLNFFSVKGPELLNMYIGESEANVRRVFQRARDARPCVIFFDELDSVAPKRGNQGDSGGVMDRIVSQLLAELDGMSGGDDGGGGVFVIGATNRPDLLDAALLRPGRFDKMLYLGIADTNEKQLTILEALTRRFTLHPSVSLRAVAEMLPFTYTGADMYALCSDAMLKAITRQAALVDQKISNLSGTPITTAQYFDHHATDEDTLVEVMESDFVAARNELVGSVSAQELEHYRRVRKTFENADQKNSAVDIDKPFDPRRAASSLSHDKTEPHNVKSSRYVINNDGGPQTSNVKASVNGMHSKGKGKAKAKNKAHVNGSSESTFLDPSAEDSDLYD